MGAVDDIERDRQLVERARRDPEAFGIIFDLYYGKLLSYALKRTGDAQAAEDIVADTFIKALKNLWHFTWRGIPFSAWLYRIAGNEVNMYLRRKKRSMVSLDLLAEAGFDAADDSAAQEREMLAALLEEQTQFVLLTEALRTLPNHYQEAIALRYMEGKEIRDIAQIMHKREGTIRSLLSRGTALLREKLTAPVQQNDTESITSSEGRSVLSVVTRNIS